jgi:hypothetical protein
MRTIEIARSQQTRTFELRAALSLAKLYKTTGRDQVVREVLVPALRNRKRCLRTRVARHGKKR